MEQGEIPTQAEVYSISEMMKFLMEERPKRDVTFILEILTGFHNT